ncbi:T9SS type A sorting domain-containing protein [Flavilitoribacter nigricans]|uniref:FlgD/Vpr Ig-like domain-containing protein n=1 Tax=Flavilitoribacter nigricans (strain ATCC 23147 / DSM 23189 / NBRC 102662 / NCIMB 1420 / SS-2) TaxID=1122177 RepID=A0A2D0N329_FLAN2|nr:RICIN domain-containing protein [Flavilitoribacter nigricans]PHN02153.1 hypothetical protein CRP01_33735 [Flavilitoribacter nigricans DSM 23189 = NBRC 102662]
MLRYWLFLCFLSIWGSLDAQFTYLAGKFQDEMVTMNIKQNNFWVGGFDEDSPYRFLFQAAGFDADRSVFIIQKTEMANWYKIYHVASGRLVTVISPTGNPYLSLEADADFDDEQQLFQFIQQGATDFYKIHSRYKQGGVALVISIEDDNTDNGSPIILLKNDNIGDESYQNFELALVEEDQLTKRAILNDQNIIGKAYQIYNKLDERKLGTLNGLPQYFSSADNGPQATFLIEDGSDDGQWWTADKRWFHIRSLENGQYLTVTGSTSGSAVTFADLGPNLDNADQQFRLIPAPSGSGWYKLRSRLGNLVLEMHPGGRLIVSTPTALLPTNTRQKFAFQLDIPDDPTVRYAVVGKQHTDFLSDKGIYGEGEELVDMKRIRRADQSVYWRFINQGNGYFKIQNALTNQYIVATGGQGLGGDIDAVRMESSIANTGDYALWELIRRNDHFVFKSKYTGYFLGTPPGTENISFQITTQANIKWYLYRVLLEEPEGVPTEMDEIEESALPAGCLQAFGTSFKRGLAERVGLPAEAQYFDFIRNALGYHSELTGDELDNYIARINLNNPDHRGYLAIAVRRYVSEDLAFRNPAEWSAADVAAVNIYQNRIQTNRRNYAAKLDQSLDAFLQVVNEGDIATPSDLFFYNDANDFLWPSQYNYDELTEEQVVLYGNYIQAGANLGLRNRFVSKEASDAFELAGGIGASITAGMILHKTPIYSAIKAAVDVAAKAGSIASATTVKMISTLVSTSASVISVITVSIEFAVMQIKDAIDVRELEKDVETTVDWANTPVNIYQIMTANNLVDKSKLLEDLDFVIAMPVPNTPVPVIGGKTFTGYLHNSNDNQFTAANFSMSCRPLTIQLDADGFGTLPLDDITSFITVYGYPCNEAVIYTASQSEFDCSDVGIQTVTVYADNRLVDKECAVTVTVVDFAAPTARCKPATVLLDGNGRGNLEVDQIDDNSTDDCGIVNRWVTGLPAGGIDCDDYELSVTLHLKDAGDRESSCTTTVTVLDGIDPAAVCQPATVILDADGRGHLTPAEVDGGSSDACGISAFSLSAENFSCLDTDAPRYVVMTVVDNRGNTSNCTATVMVKDKTFPVAKCRDIAVVLGPDDKTTIQAVDLDNGSSDVCGISHLAVNQSIFTCDDLGENTVRLTVMDRSNNLAVCNSTVTVAENTPPQADCRALEVYIEPDGTYTLSPDDVDAIGGNSTDNCGIAALDVMPSHFSGLGPNAVTLTVTDLGGNSSDCSTNVTVIKRPTTLTYTGEQRVQYSDAVQLRAQLTDDVNGAGIGGQTVNFTIGQQSASALTDANGLAVTSLVITQPPSESCGRDPVYGYSVTAGYAGTEVVYEPDADEHLSFFIAPEDARITYTGALFVSTANAKSSSADLLLTATIQDISLTADANGDDLAGNIGYTTVNFIDRDGSVINPAPIPVLPVDADDPGVGVAVYTWEGVDIGNNDSRQFVVGVEVCGHYIRNTPEDDVVITVSRPLDDFVTGGGSLLLQHSAGPLAGDVGSRQHFGFNIKFNKAGTNLMGDIRALIRRTEANGLRVYQIKGNKMTSLSTEASNGSAVFYGKANVEDVTDPNNPIPVFGNGDFQVVMTDNGNPGTLDLLGLTLYDNNGFLRYSSHWTGAETAQQLLAAGNLVVRNGNNKGIGRSLPGTYEPSGSTTVNKSSGFQARAFPNPFTNEVNIYFNLPVEGYTTVRIFDASGRQIEVLTEQFLESGEHRLSWNGRHGEGNSLPPGVYLIRLTSGSLVWTNRLVRQ